MPLMCKCLCFRRKFCLSLISECPTVSLCQPNVCFSMRNGPTSYILTNGCSDCAGIQGHWGSMVTRPECVAKMWLQVWLSILHPGSHYPGFKKVHWFVNWSIDINTQLKALPFACNSVSCLPYSVWPALSYISLHRGRNSASNSKSG